MNIVLFPSLIKGKQAHTHNPLLILTLKLGNVPDYCLNLILEPDTLSGFGLFQHIIKYR